jgi:hypothetical protein
MTSFTNRTNPTVREWLVKPSVYRIRVSIIIFAIGSPIKTSKTVRASTSRGEGGK